MRQFFGASESVPSTSSASIASVKESFIESFAGGAASPITKPSTLAAARACTSTLGDTNASFQATSAPLNRARASTKFFASNIDLIASSIGCINASNGSGGGV